MSFRLYKTTLGLDMYTPHTVITPSLLPSDIIYSCRLFLLIEVLCREQSPPWCLNGWKISNRLSGKYFIIRSVLTVKVSIWNQPQFPNSLLPFPLKRNVK